MHDTHNAATPTKLMVHNRDGAAIRLHPVNTTKASAALGEMRCPACGKLLAMVTLPPGSVISIKCTRCDMVLTREVALSP